MKKTISVDLDGVLNIYDGNYKENQIPDIKDGAKEFLHELSKFYNIHIFTVRSTKLVKSWLEKYNLSDIVSEISDKKSQYSSIILDDRAINFEGNFQYAIEKIKNFKPHWKY